MIEALKLFIERNIDLIEDRKFEELYGNASAEYMNERDKIKPTDINALTDILTDLFGEEPIFDANITYVPNCYRMANDKIHQVEIPEGIRAIGRSAFQDCINLEYVKLPKTLSEIYPGAFKGCENLTKIFYNGSKADWSHVSLGWRVFASSGWIRQDKTIYCNDGEVIV